MHRSNGRTGAATGFDFSFRKPTRGGGAIDTAVWLGIPADQHCGKVDIALPKQKVFRRWMSIYDSCVYVMREQTADPAALVFQDDLSWATVTNRPGQCSAGGVSTHDTCTDMYRRALARTHSRTDTHTLPTDKSESLPWLERFSFEIDTGAQAFRVRVRTSEARQQWTQAVERARRDLRHENELLDQVLVEDPAPPEQHEQVREAVKGSCNKAAAPVEEDDLLAQLDEMLAYDATVAPELAPMLFKKFKASE